ncbi:MAG: hypothetical protein JXB14_07260 [Candidatus Altiarchaeota archaeon]|nr:hypothetical protein [Candidatus Altiarchaeota archaeon]
MTYLSLDPAWIIAALAIIFAVWFWYTSKLSGCWYRRYVMPIMLVSFAFFLPQWGQKFLVLIAALFVYEGYMGYGRERLEDEKQGKEKTKGGKS